MTKKLITEIPTLMVAQPWAQLIADGYKDIENRTKNCKLRGTVALYASMSKATLRFQAADEMGHTFDPEDISYGVILGFVNIIDVMSGQNRKGYKGKWYHPGSFGIWLANPIKLKTPVRVRFPNGVINWGKLKGASLKKCLDQLTTKQLAAITPINNVK